MFLGQKLEFLGLVYLFINFNRTLTVLTSILSHYIEKVSTNIPPIPDPPSQISRLDVNKCIELLQHRILQRWYQLESRDIWPSNDCCIEERAESVEGMDLSIWVRRATLVRRELYLTNNWVELISQGIQTSALCGSNNLAQIIFSDSLNQIGSVNGSQQNGSEVCMHSEI